MKKVSPAFKHFKLWDLIYHTFFHWRSLRTACSTPRAPAWLLHSLFTWAKSKCSDSRQLFVGQHWLWWQYQHDNSNAESSKKCFAHRVSIQRRKTQKIRTWGIGSHFALKSYRDRALEKALKLKKVIIAVCPSIKKNFFYFSHSGFDLLDTFTPLRIPPLPYLFINLLGS